MRLTALVSAVIIPTLWIIVGLWLLLIGPPWLALAGLIVWLSRAHWSARAAVISLAGILWSLAIGISPVAGIALLVSALWGESLSKRIIPDFRWRVWLISGLVSAVFVSVYTLEWSTLFFFFWLLQGLATKIMIPIFPGQETESGRRYFRPQME